MPHTSDNTSGIEPIGNGSEVTIVEPALRVDILRGMDIDEIEHIKRRILTRPLIYILGLTRVPVHIRHHAAHRAFAIFGAEHRPQPLRLRRSVLIT